MDDTITTVPGFRWAARPLAEQDPRTGGIDHQQHNCIQFRGERHRAGARAFGARRQQCATVVGIDVNARSGRLQAGAAPMPIEPSPITQTLVCAAMLVSL
ncbi:hypothetical protein BANRA_05580 [Klebsiella pneumoniae]|nr:hypothetical protein BANRA_05580 [Klebsiella pneumoniae]